MANPFKKRKHYALGTGLVIGTVAAGIAGYLFYKKNGSDMRNMLADKIDKLRLKYFSKQKPNEASEETPAYLAHHQKAPKTDREKLLKHQILATDKPE